MDVIWGRDWTDFVAHMQDEFAHQCFAAFKPYFERDIGINALALDFMRAANHSRFGDGGMADQRAFHFRRAHAVPGDIDHVIDAPGNPLVAMRIAARAVASEVVAAIGGKIGVDKALLVAPERAHLSGPGIGDDQITLGGTFQNAAFGV